MTKISTFFIYFKDSIPIIIPAIVSGITINLASLPLNFSQNAQVSALIIMKNSSGDDSKI